jgi:hypothetical protein
MQKVVIKFMVNLKERRVRGELFFVPYGSYNDDDDDAKSTEKMKIHIMFRSYIRKKRVRGTKLCASK